MAVIRSCGPCSVCALVYVLLNCPLVCKRTQVFGGLYVPQRCPNLYTQRVVSNQRKPWGFKVANYNV